jgi:hypothetical protein
LLSWASQPEATHPLFLVTSWTGHLASAAANRSWRWSCGQPKLSRRCPPCREAGTSPLRRRAHRGGPSCAAALCDVVRLSRPPARLQPRCWLPAASALRALLRPHNVWASRPYDPTSCVVSTPLAPPCRKRPVNSVMRAHPAEAGCPLIRGVARRRLLATLASRRWPSSFQSSDGTPRRPGSPPCSSASLRICRRAARVTTGLASPYLPSARHRSGSSPAPPLRGVSRTTPILRRPARWVPRRTRRPCVRGGVEHSKFRSACTRHPPASEAGVFLVHSDAALPSAGAAHFRETWRPRSPRGALATAATRRSRHASSRSSSRNHTAVDTGRSSYVSARRRLRGSRSWCRPRLLPGVPRGVGVTGGRASRCGLCVRRAPPPWEGSLASSTTRYVSLPK